MSQIRFTAEVEDRPVMVLTGYDSPLDNYFFTVFRSDTEDEEVVASSMSDPEADTLGGYPTPEKVVQKLEAVGIRIPSLENWNALILRQEGNKRYRYSEATKTYI